MKIKELLATPDKWTKGAFARDKEGNPVLEYMSNAICYCLSGAIFKCYSLDKNTIHSLVAKEVGMAVSTWNDAPERTHAEVLALCEKLDI